MNYPVLNQVVELPGEFLLNRRKECKEPLAVCCSGVEHEQSP